MSAIKDFNCNMCSNTFGRFPVIVQVSPSNCFIRCTKVLTREYTSYDYDGDKCGGFKLLQYRGHR